MTIDYLILIREVDDLKVVDFAAQAKKAAKEQAVAIAAAVAADGEARLIALQAEVDAANAAAKAEADKAIIDSEVADQLVSAQIDHIRKLLVGEATADPTINNEDIPPAPLPPVIELPVEPTPPVEPEAIAGNVGLVTEGEGSE